MTAARYTKKTDEADARERLRAFWAGSSLGRPALNVTVERAGWQAPAWPGPALSLKERDLLPAWHAWQLAPANQRHQFLAEAMPYTHLNWGSFLVTLPVLAGGNYEYHDSAWIEPVPNLFDQPLPVFDRTRPVAQALERCYDTARQVIGTRALVTPPLMLDGLTTLAMFRGGDQLALDLADQPATVKAWSGALTTMYCAIYEHYFQRLGYGESVCFFGPLAEGRSEGVQCDFAVNLSPAMFAEFVLPDLRRTTDYLDHSLYHLDGTCQLRFLDLLRQCPKLTGIQWNPETTAARPPHWLAAFREIRRRGLVLYIWCTVPEAILLVRELGPDGLFLSLPTFATVAEAHAAIAQITKACHPC